MSRACTLAAWPALAATNILMPLAIPASALPLVLRHARRNCRVYILPGYQDFGAILARLGPHRMGKACLYIRHLNQVDLGVLAELVVAGLADLRTRWPVTPD